MKKSFIFPGQGAQFTGMGKDIYEKYPDVKKTFDLSNEILGFDIVKIMFEGSSDELKQTKVTQPAVFIHSVAMAKVIEVNSIPDMVAGHSLGEFSALVANKVLSFEDALLLVSKRAMAMQKACDIKPSTMAAILGFEDEKIEKICNDVEGIVVPANYNCVGQLVVSGEIDAINKVCELAKESGAKRALPLPVGGAFHSPLMEPAREELANAIENTNFNTPICPIYQNVTADAVNSSQEIKKNLISQLTAPVRWTQSVKKMIEDGATDFIELGPGNVLQGLVKKIDRSVNTSSLVIE